MSSDVDNQISAEEAEKIANEVWSKSESTSPSTEVVAEAPNPPVEEEITPEVPKEVTAPAAEVPVVQNNNPYSWVDSLTDEELKAKVVAEIRAKEKISHEFRSENGRYRAVSARLTDAEKALAALRSATEKPKQPVQPVEKQESPDTPEWKLVSEADPVLAKAIQERVEALIKQRLPQLSDEFDAKLETKLAAVQDPFKQHLEAQRIEAEAQRLKSIEPDVDLISSSQIFHDWLSSKSESFRNNALSYTDHRDVAEVLSLFRAQTAHIPGLWSQPNAQIVTQTTNVSTADRVAKERADKLHNAAAIRLGSTPTPVGNSSGNKDLSIDDANKFIAELWKKKFK